MARLLFCSLQLLLAVAFSMPGCAKNARTLRPPEPVDDPGGLHVGTSAPEIAGEDIDGESLKLSDYRGQVVLVDFWGNW